LHEVGFESATYATVLESDKTIVIPSDNATFGYKVGIDIHFADVVYDDCETYSFPVGEYTVEESGLPAAEISGQQEYRS